MTEQVPDGWRLIGLVCDDASDDTRVDFDAGTAIIAVGVNEIVTCTFTNTPDSTTTTTTTTPTTTPTTLAPILPPTGSGSARPSVVFATVVLVVGLAALTLARTRRRAGGRGV